MGGPSRRQFDLVENWSPLSNQALYNKPSA